ncbi:uncharacterized protein [Antedon mediterranea]|uniref:uncharacterized protein n=1 Tax=Antedon mediterranea TaxID=105859 RepID=UPI003AF80FFA
MARRSEEDPLLTLRECLENIATCSICFEVMDQPKQLSCGHAFCLKCLKKYVATQARQQGKSVSEVDCATCRQSTTIPKRSGIKGLASFFVAERAKDSLDKADKARTNNKSRCNRPKHNRQLNSWCTDCSELICDVCYKSEHLRHNILTVNEALEIVNQLFEACLKENSEYKTQIDKINNYKNILKQQKDNYVKDAIEKEEEEFKKRVRDIEIKAEEIEKSKLGELEDTLNDLEIVYTSSKNVTDNFQQSKGDVPQQLLYMSCFKPGEKQGFLQTATTALRPLLSQPDPFIPSQDNSCGVSSIVSSMEEDMHSFSITTIQDALKYYQKEGQSS